MESIFNETILLFEKFSKNKIVSLKIDFYFLKNAQPGGNSFFQINNYLEAG